MIDIYHPCFTQTHYTLANDRNVKDNYCSYTYIIAHRVIHPLRRSLVLETSPSDNPL